MKTVQGICRSVKKSHSLLGQRSKAMKQVTEAQPAPGMPCCGLEGFGRAVWRGALVIWEGNEEGQKDIKQQWLKNIFKLKNFGQIYSSLWVLRVEIFFPKKAILPSWQGANDKTQVGLIICLSFQTPSPSHHYVFSWNVHNVERKLIFTYCVYRRIQSFLVFALEINGMSCVSYSKNP